ncbi:MAG: cyclic nucleotide-binding domain-containing protein, partial [Flavobacteriaceae bacterium]|nr:cyclic nucleotide-binding domain-containing protein [Flavobacteriaceae bacterium]
TLDVDDKFENLAEYVGPAVFGQNCLLEGTKRPVNSIVLSEKATLYVIPKDNIQNIMESNEEIKTKLMTSLATLYESRLSTMIKNYRTLYGLFNLGDVF